MNHSVACGHRRSSPEMGITILECVVALAVFSVVLTIAAQWFRIETHHVQRTQTRTLLEIRADNVVAVFVADPRAPLRELQETAGNQLIVRVDSFETDQRQGFHLRVSEIGMVDGLTRDCWEWL